MKQNRLLVITVSRISVRYDDNSPFAGYNKDNRHESDRVLSATLHERDPVNISATTRRGDRAREKSRRNLRRYSRRDYIYNNMLHMEGINQFPPFIFFIREGSGTGSERRWMSDRKLLRSCHEGALAMRAVHPFSRNSNLISEDSMLAALNLCPAEFFASKVKISRLQKLLKRK